MRPNATPGYPEKLWIILWGSSAALLRGPAASGFLGIWSAFAQITCRQQKMFCNELLEGETVAF